MKRCEDGGKLEGIFKDDYLVEGTEITSFGETLKGKFEHGYLIGHGKHIYANGDYYEGEFHRDRR